MLSYQAKLDSLVCLGKIIANRDKKKKTRQKITKKKKNTKKVEKNAIFWQSGLDKFSQIL